MHAHAHARRQPQPRLRARVALARVHRPARRAARWFECRRVTPPSRRLQALGNAAFSAGRYDDAVKHFSDAIAADGSNHVLFSNRSAAQARARPPEGIGPRGLRRARAPTPRRVLARARAA